MRFLRKNKKSQSELDISFVAGVSSDMKGMAKEDIMAVIACGFHEMSRRSGLPRSQHVSECLMSALINEGTIPENAKFSGVMPVEVFEDEITSKDSPLQ